MFENIGTCLFACNFLCFQHDYIKVYIAKPVPCTIPGQPHYLIRQWLTLLPMTSPTRARIHLSNMRCEARTLTEQRDILEQAEREAKDRAQAAMKELASSRLKISQVPSYRKILT